jgi:hypothetical protein
MEMICPKPCNYNNDCAHRVPHEQNPYCVNYQAHCGQICVDAFLHKVKETIRKADESNL